MATPAYTVEAAKAAWLAEESSRQGQVINAPQYPGTAYLISQGYLAKDYATNPQPVIQQQPEIPGAYAIDRTSEAYFISQGFTQNARELSLAARQNPATPTQAINVGGVEIPLSRQGIEVGGGRVEQRLVADERKLMEASANVGVNPFTPGSAQYLATERQILEKYGTGILPASIQKDYLAGGGEHPRAVVPGAPINTDLTVGYTTEYRAWVESRDALRADVDLYLQQFTGPQPITQGQLGHMHPSTAKRIAEEVAAAGGGAIDPTLGKRAVEQGATGISFGYVDPGYNQLASMRGDEIGGKAVLSISTPAYIQSSIPPDVFKTGMGQLNPSKWNPETQTYDLRVGTYSHEDSKGALQFGSGEQTYFFLEGALPSGYEGKPGLNQPGWTPPAWAINVPGYPETYQDTGRIQGSKILAAIPATTDIIPATKPTLPVQEQIGKGIDTALKIGAPNQAFAYGVSANILKGISDISGGFLSLEPLRKNILKGFETYSAKKEFELQDTAYQNQYNLAKKQGLISPAGEFTGSQEQFSNLKNFETAREKALTHYQGLTASLVGTEPNEKMMTAGIAAPFLSFGEAYSKTITEPFENFIAPSAKSNPFSSVIASAAAGFISVPGGLAETGGMALSGGERTLKNIGNFPALAAAGGAMQYESIAADPVKAIAALAGTYLAFEAGGMAISRGTGVMRTIGKDYIPIEQIGYLPEEGYPLGPRGMSSRDLRASFRQNTLIPVPQRMSLAEEVPRIPTNTALAGEVPGDVYMWTAWEKSPVKDAIKQMSLSRYALQEGGSELPGMYGSSVLQTYFNKIAGSSSEMIPAIGFEMPNLFPTALRTRLAGLDAIPEWVSRSGYDSIRSYTQRNVEGGRAYLPRTKLEYEAVLQMGNVMEMTGSRFYTKVGGFGGSRLFGQRIPIIEQTATGEMVSPLNLGKGIAGSAGDYYLGKPGPYIEGFSLAVSIPRITMGYRKEGDYRTSPGRMDSAIAIDRALSSSRTPPWKQPFAELSGGKRSSSSTRAPGSSGSSLRSSPVFASSSLPILESRLLKSAGESTSDGYSMAYSPGSYSGGGSYGGSYGGHSPRASPPYYAGEYARYRPPGAPDVPPPPYIPGSPFSLKAESVPSTFNKRRWKRFSELLSFTRNLSDIRRLKKFGAVDLSLSFTRRLK